MKHYEKTPPEILAENIKRRLELKKERDAELDKRLGIIKSFKPKIHQKKKDKKRVDKILEMWKLTGYYIEPTENQILNEILNDELNESDEIEYIELEDDDESDE
jgi:uncharacterized protein YpuA (DUF1002 family)